MDARPRTLSYTLEARPWTLNAERSGGGRGHGHWATTRRLTAFWRESFWALGLQNRQRLQSAHVIVKIVQKAPLSDTGNCYGAVKAALDGLVDAGILPDDTPRTILSLTMLAPCKAQKGEREHLTLTLVEPGVAGDLCPVYRPF